MAHACDCILPIHACHPQPARARVAARFGPELPQGAEEIILLKELPGEIGALAASFKQQVGSLPQEQTGHY